MTGSVAGLIKRAAAVNAYLSVIRLRQSRSFVWMGRFADVKSEDAKESS
jgi:hypothetical protein